MRIGSLRTISLLLLIGLVALAGCGGDDDGSDSDGSGAEQSTAARDQQENSAPKEEDGATQGTEAPVRRGTSVTLGDSEFGSMLFDSKRQAIYIFERDEKDRSNCYGECAAAWPPVYTRGEPRAGKGVDRSLLGTTKRRDGRLQVTYAGQPLYFYANEGPGEVKCHNINLNGGFWWVVGPDGKRRA